MKTKLGIFSFGIDGAFTALIFIEIAAPFIFGAVGALRDSFDVMDFTIAFIGFTLEAICLSMLGSFNFAIYYFLPFFAIFRFKPWTLDMTFFATLPTGFLKPTPGKLFELFPMFNLLFIEASGSGIGGVIVGDIGALIGEPRFIASPLTGGAPAGGMDGGIIGNGIIIG